MGSMLCGAAQSTKKADPTEVESAVRFADFRNQWVLLCHKHSPAAVLLATLHVIYVNDDAKLQNVLEMVVTLQPF